MSTQTYLIDTNIIIGLEDNHTVKPVFSSLVNLASKHQVTILVHEVAREDIQRDRNKFRQKISLSKLEKFQTLKKVRGLSRNDLEQSFGSLPRENDVVDATLLDAVNRGAADFLVSEDRGLHDCARRHSPELGRRVLFVADAVQLLQITYEPVEAPVKFVEEIDANEIPVSDPIFDSLRHDYDGFDLWWREKCVRLRRKCWIIEDNGIAGIVVRKDEEPGDTEATMEGEKILKICTFKVRPENRGTKLGELLLKKIFWFAQINNYEIAYITAFGQQSALLDLLEYYGFVHTCTKDDGELIYEKVFSRKKIDTNSNVSDFDIARLNYPRFIIRKNTRAFGIPIKESYHDSLYPDLKIIIQPDLFAQTTILGVANRPGNTIRKVYLCRAPSKLGSPGSLLFFYKGKSKSPPSQALTAIGVFEEWSEATSVRDLMHFTGGRSVYSEIDLVQWDPSPERPVKVINFLLVRYIDPPIGLTDLKNLGVFGAHPPQSIFEIGNDAIFLLLEKSNLGFEI